MIKLVCLFIFVLSASAEASVEKDSFMTDEFVITKIPEDWTKINVGDKSEIFLALKSKTEDTSLTLRQFDSPDPSLKRSAVSWLKDYKSYGFKITKGKPVKLNDETYGYQIEALHKKSGKVFNQYMTIKNKKLLVLTCHSDKLNKEFDKCGESLTSFSWKASL